MMSLLSRADCLKQYEEECYSICYYLLQQEESALRASRQALTSLLDDAEFYRKDAADRQETVRKLSKLWSLRVYQERIRK